MSGRLSGKRIVITGAGQGIGRAAAIACAAEGAVVTAVDLNAAQLDSLAAHSKISETLVLDVQNAADIAALAKRLAPQDGLFNCVGFVHDGTILDCDPAAFDHSFSLNVRTMYLMTRAFLPGMIEKAKTGNSPSIVNMASMASSIKGFPRRFVYGATKAAVIGMTKAIAADYVAARIRCNALCPGTVDTPSLRARIASASDPVAAEAAFIARQPMGRLATVDDITPQIVFLLSDESKFVTGQAILVDGGVTI